MATFRQLSLWAADRFRSGQPGSCDHQIRLLLRRALRTCLIRNSFVTQEQSRFFNTTREMSVVGKEFTYISYFIVSVSMLEKCSQCQPGKEWVLSSMEKVAFLFQGDPVVSCLNKGLLCIQCYL